MSTTVKRVILYIITVISAAYPFVKPMIYGSAWDEFFIELIIFEAVAFFCHTLAGVLKRLDKLEKGDRE